MSKHITLENLSRFKAKNDALYAAKSDVTTLIGSDSGKSVRTIANEELAAQLIAENAQASLDTLAEIASWIQNHPGDASAMNAAIAALQAKVDTGDQTVSAYVTAAIAALNIGSYAKAADLTAVAARMTTAEGNITNLQAAVNGLGDMASKDEVSEEDLAAELAEKVNAAAEGNHSHSNKTVIDGITAAKVSAWDGKSDFSGSYNDLTDKPTIPAAYTHPSSHPASMITGLADVATSGSYEDLTNKPTIPAAYSHPASHPASMITGLATVATSGKYSDLTGLPTIPTIEFATDAEIDALFA